ERTEGGRDGGGGGGRRRGQEDQGPQDGRRRPKSAAHQKQEQRHRAGPLGGPHGSLGSALGPPPWRAPHTPGTLTNVRLTRAPRGGKRARPAAPACRAWPREGEGREEDMQRAAAGGAGGSRRRRPARPSPPLGGRRSEDDVVVLLRAVQRAGHIEGRHGRWHRQALGL
ncbi:unnamed protein product, partial [Prorocentrum cordatum]